jgi:uncharacterized protein YjbI with pentapeptide repeats
VYARRVPVPHPAIIGATTLALAAGGLLAAGAHASDVRDCRIVASPTAARHTTCRNMDLRRINLSGRNLRFADFRGSSLQRANLSGANLYRARLQLANLSGARMVRVRAAGARMTAAGLTRANLRGANLTRARMDGTIMLTRADLTGANLTRVNLSGALMLRTTVKGADFTGARLTNVAGANVAGTPRAVPAGWRVVQGWFAGPTANMWGATFTDADLSGINLSGSVLIYASFLGTTTLRGTPMTGAALTGSTWSWDFSANGGAGGPDGGTVTCPDGRPATPGYNSGLPGVGPFGC